MRSGRACLNWGTLVLLATLVARTETTASGDGQTITRPIDISAVSPGGPASNDVEDLPIPPAGPRSAPICSNSGDLTDPFLVTRAAAGCLHRDVSDVQTTLGLLGLGFSCRASGLYAVADDFVVPAGQIWTIDQIVLYLYQQDVSTPSITTVGLRLQTSSPLGETIPALTSCVPAAGWTNVQKNQDIDNPTIDCTRRIQECVVTLALPYAASAGTHYLIWQASGTGTSGPWVPPVVVPGATSKAGANAMQAWSGSSGRFVAIVDSGSSGAPQDLVFVLCGSITGAALPGDMNCDGVVDYADINPFVAALQSQTMYTARYPNCRWLNADVNRNGQVNYADIGAFVRLLGAPPMPLPGDLNCDGTVDYADIGPFVLALGNPAAYEARHPDCNYFNADTNGDGSVDYADINPFVRLLSGS